LKTAIVTGASKGVGYATVKLLSENGYKVIAVSRDLSKVSGLVGDNVEVYQMDITNANELRKFYDQYKDITLDLLVNNAGGGAGPTSIINETMDNFRRAYDINVSGPMYLSQLFVPCMKKSESATIIFVSSLGGKYPYIAITAEDMAESIRWVASLPKHVNINHIEINHILSGK